MNVLIIDKSEVAAQLAKVKLEKLGYKVEHEASKEKALELIKANQYDIILLDPAPLPDAKSIILNIRHAGALYAYITLLTSDGDQEKAIAAGANDAMAKPINQEDLIIHIENASRLTSLIKRIGDCREDFPSAGGIIAKSAFNQLFSAAFERGGRYGERTHVMFVSLENYDDILKENGAYAANLMIAGFSKALTSIRRQSDIVGQTAAYEYAVLLQRPRKPNEPKQAAGRFADTLQNMLEYDNNISSAGRMRVKLVELPTGQKTAEYEWDIRPAKDSAAE